MAQLSHKYFPSWLYYMIDFSKDELAPLIEEVEPIKANPQNFPSYNYGLKGNVSAGYELHQSIPFLNDLLLPYVYDYATEFDFFSQYTVLKKDAPLFLWQPWVNFQKRYEYNPIHNHSGLFSFVIWLEVPYDIDSAIQANPEQKESLELEGAFNFHFGNAMGQIDTQTIKIDKSMMYKGIIFPAKLYHSIYPFYCSDGIRISVAGNFYFDN